MNVVRDVPNGDENAPRPTALESHQPQLDPGSVFLAVVEDGPRISFAAYNEEENVMYLETSLADGYEVQDLVERVLVATRPTMMLLPNKIVGNHDFLALLTTMPPTLEGGGLENDEIDGVAATAVTGADAIMAIAPQGVRNHMAPREDSRSIPYRIIKTSILDVRACKAAIMKLRVMSIATKGNHQRSQSFGPLVRRNFPPNQNRMQSFPVSNYHALASIIDFDCKVQVQAIGSLLSFLQTTVFQHVEGGLVTVNNIFHLQTGMFMKISIDTLSALHIFSTEYHPLVAAKGTGNSKEGCSLFSLMDRTKTAAGRQRLREWMLKPLLSVEMIARRQNGVELFLRPDFQVSTQTLMDLMPHVGPVVKILTRIQKASTRPADFIALPRTISYALAVCETLEHGFRSPLRRLADVQQRHVHLPAPDVVQDELQEIEVAAYLEFIDYVLGRCHVTMLQELLGHITCIVDEDATSERNQLVVLRGFSEELDDCKDKYDNLGGIMSAFETQVVVRAPGLRDHLKAMFFPQIGFLVALRSHSSWTNDMNSLPEDFKHIFTESNLHYFKCTEMHDLDNEFGDLDAYIKDTEKLIACQLEDDILECESDLRETFSALADLDCILSFANVASDLGYIKPTVVPSHEKCIKIRNGSHPLQELLLEENKQFVRNDVTLDQNHRVHIITGPNFSGKSCYARQVGILTYMAQLGSFIPCEAARISVVDRMLSQFSTVETCAVPQSSFQIDLTRMGSILRFATSSSLVIIDEFGKGTAPASGIGLLAAALQKLSRVGSVVVCTTHFLEMFSLELIKDGDSGIKALQMEVQIPENANGAATPLFRLKEGVALSSAGLVCAKISGVKQSVIERAQEIVATMLDGRQIEPLVEILRDNIADEEREVSWTFIKKDWKETSDEYVADFRERILSLSD